ncbi:hypothetical protein [Leucobacter sp. cx-169]|uniref:hypothetical protein n=1 Tax=Leucobacter sp. cx-169 TaxID=2770549 RepID=UPI00165D6F15|nr:hypothetical protein [Leucobacter sp. cx-169]MBC9927386.1 hypothetical protein [Leucobacter sp. cx-169]
MSTSRVLDKARHDRGTRVAGAAIGGQFARQQRDSSVGPIGAPEGSRPQFTVEEDFARTRGMVSAWLSKRETFGDHEDIVQDTTLELFEWAKRHNLSDLSVHHTPMIRAYAQRNRSVYANGGERHETGAGRKVLRERRDELENTLGRPATSAEVKVLAEEVRLSFPPGRRPAPGFENGVFRPVPLMVEDFDGNESERHIATYDQYPSDSEGGDTAAFARALDRFEDASGQAEDARSRARALTAARAEAKAQLWSVIAENDTNTPPTQVITVSQARSAKKTLSSAPDGAWGAANRWLEGECPRDEEKALLAPFGGAENLSFDQQNAVIERIAGDSKRGQMLWEAALKTDK